MELRGSVAVVTGASSGIGRATAWALAGAGAGVVLVARREEGLNELAGQMAERGWRAVPVAADVSKRTDVERLRVRVTEEFGRLDVLVNSAGIPGGGAFMDLSLKRIEEITRIDYLSVLYCTRILLPLMLERGSGHVVNVASLAGRFATPGASVYGAAKHAVVAFSEALYYELEPEGILVTAVNPGFVDTEGFPHPELDPRMVMKPERVARAIVAVLQRGIAPEMSVPRWIGPLQLFRVATPPLYRWGVRRAASISVRPAAGSAAGHGAGPSAPAGPPGEAPDS
jgi:short-subunit dehydrogenase